MIENQRHTIRIVDCKDPQINTTNNKDVENEHPLTKKDAIKH